MSIETAAPPLPPKIPAAERTVYILDDEPEIGNMVADALRTSGFTARQFTAAPPFLNELDVAFPGFIVLDLALGQSDAIEIIHRLEVLKYDGKILLISSRDEATLAQIAAIGERHGMTMLTPLQKPFRAHDVRTRLIEHQGERQPEPEESRAAPKKAKKIVVQVTDALRKNWLELWYQPVIDLKTLTVGGAEGLLRARHPELGIIGPDSILPPSGDPAYAPLTQFVVERAVRDWRRFTAQGLPLKLAVNVPISVIAQPDFIAMIRRVLPTDAGFPGLTMEVTEDEVSRDPQWMQEIATQLGLYNVHIAIDDFGKACASLSRVADLRVVELKIDRSFVSGCASNQTHRLLCHTVVDLAHRFGATACAKGVETAADLRTLIEIGADRAQGFLFADPMPADRLMQKLLAGHGRFASHAP